MPHVGIAMFVTRTYRAFFLWIDRSYLWRSLTTMGNVWRLSSEWARFFGRFLVRGRTEPFWMYGFPSVANRFPVHY